MAPRSLDLRTFPLSSILPNPFRQLDQFPLDPEQLAELRASVKKAKKLWAGMRCRLNQDNQPEIVDGHHRLAVARETYPPDYEFPLLVEQLTDSEMVLEMALANPTVTPNTFSHVVMAVRAVVEQFAGDRLLLEAPSAKVNKTLLRNAPHYSCPPATGAHDHLYTAQTVAEFLGWIKGTGEARDAVRWALDALMLVERGVLSMKDLLGISSATRAEALVTEGMKAMAADDERAKARAQHARIQEEEALELKQKADEAKRQQKAEQAERDRQAAIAREQEKARKQAEREAAEAHKNAERKAAEQRMRDAEKARREAEAAEARAATQAERQKREAAKAQFLADRHSEKGAAARDNARFLADRAIAAAREAISPILSDDYVPPKKKSGGEPPKPKTPVPPATPLTALREIQQALTSIDELWLALRSSGAVSPTDALPWLKLHAKERQWLLKRAKQPSVKSKKQTAKPKK